MGPELVVDANTVRRIVRLADLMRRLHRHEVVDRDVSRTVLRWIGTNTDLSMVASSFDLDPLAHAEPDRGVRLVNKTGTISTVRADIGVVEGPAANAAYAVLASRADDVTCATRCSPI